jgi:hypothetical protein
VGRKDELVSKKIFLPFIVKEDSLKDEFELQLFTLIYESSYQRRTAMHQHPLLWLAAQKKADDMAEKDYFGHTSPSGFTANELVRSVGYKLPDWYREKGNNVESIAVGGNKPENIAISWLNSPRHRDHVYAEAAFYKEQQCIGIGKSKAKDGRLLTVFISAVCAGN